MQRNKSSFFSFKLLDIDLWFSKHGWYFGFMTPLIAIFINYRYPAINRDGLENSIGIEFIQKVYMDEGGYYYRWRKKWITSFVPHAEVEAKWKPE